MQITIIVLSFLIGVAYLFLIRSFDRYEKDSILRLIISFIIGGLTSVVITTLLYSNVTVEHNFRDAFLKVGLIEEVSKMSGFLIILLLFRKSINEIVDGLIYMSAVALGFACIENVFYALGSSEPLLLLFQRAIYSVAGHLSFAGYMGIALFIHFKRRRNIIGVIISLILAVLAHGLFDGVLFEAQLNELFHYVFIFLVVAHIFLYKIVLSFSSFRPDFSHDLFPVSEQCESHFCQRCERERESALLKYNNVEAFRCNTCQNFTFNKQAWLNFIKFFRPLINSRRYGRFLSSEFHNHKPVELDSGGNVIFDPKLRQVAALEEPLKIWVNHHNRIDQERLLKRPIIGLLLKYLGLRYLLK
jgi:RsiW-degrading membrane proteinase PrsW (M82 family)